MPRPPITYREAVDAIQRTYLIIVRISIAPRLPRTVRTELQTLAQDLWVLIARDNGRSR